MRLKSQSDSSRCGLDRYRRSAACSEYAPLTIHLHMRLRGIGRRRHRRRYAGGDLAGHPLFDDLREAGGSTLEWCEPAAAVAMDSFCWRAEVEGGDGGASDPGLG